MEKIIKTFEYKIQLREKEILEADIQVDNNNFKKVVPTSREPKVDPFFQTIDMHPVEKRVVQRDGLIPKLKKNIEKEAKEQQEREERDAKKQMEKQWGKRPIKIKASSYRGANKVEGNDDKPKHQML